MVALQVNAGTAAPSQGEGAKPGRPFLKILSAWVNMNQSQYVVRETAMAENTNLVRRFCVIDKRYRGIVRPQRNPRLNLTGQGYWNRLLKIEALEGSPLMPDIIADSVPRAL